MNAICDSPVASQVVRVARLSGAERPLEILYFVEGPSGKRIPAETTALTLNRLDLQRAAIVLGHRVQRPLAQRESITESFNRAAHRSNRLSLTYTIYFENKNPSVLGVISLPILISQTLYIQHLCRSQQT